MEIMNLGIFVRWDDEPRLAVVTITTQFQMGDLGLTIQSVSREVLPGFLVAQTRMCLLVFYANTSQINSISPVTALTT
jgi:hypothetical protein